jgi:hypothetical protein
MIAVEQAHVSRVPVVGLAVGLAVIAALSYVLISLGMLSVGDPVLAERPPVMMAVAAMSYLLGGVLILRRRRWLWVAGAVINALVMLLFFQMYQDRPAVLFSPAGLASKIPQVLLEATLIYLIISNWRTSRRSA